VLHNDNVQPTVSDHYTGWSIKNRIQFSSYTIFLQPLQI